MAVWRERLRGLAYDLGPGRWYQSAWRFIVADVDLREGAWLDVGCGPGILCALAASGNPSLDVVGIDISPGMLVQARQHKGGMLNVTLRQMDAAAIVYPEGTFHVATAIQSAHHWQDPAAILREVHRVLVPGGRFYIYEADPEGEIPEGWIDRQAGFPPEALLRRRWRRFGMDQARWDGLKAKVEESPFGMDYVDERHGFYRRLVCTR